MKQPYLCRQGKSVNNMIFRRIVILAYKVVRYRQECTSCKECLCASRDCTFLRLFAVHWEKMPDCQRLCLMISRRPVRRWPWFGLTDRSPKVEFVVHFYIMNGLDTGSQAIASESSSVRSVNNLARRCSQYKTIVKWENPRAINQKNYERVESFRVQKCRWLRYLRMLPNGNLVNLNQII